MSSQELRLKCLELVLTHLDIRDPEEIIAVAEEFYNFVIPDEVYKREKKLASNGIIKNS
jgi:hypothetical protein